MFFVRMFFAAVVIGAFVALGYAFWLTFQPFDSPPRGSGEDAGVIVVSEADPVAPDPPAVNPSANDKLPAAPVLDQLRRPVEAAREVRHVAREVGAEAKRVREDIEQALPAPEDRTFEHAWRTAQQAGRDFMELDQIDPAALPVPSGRGRVHASGAPPHNGGGKTPGRQPGIDWYKAGGQPPRE